MSVKDQNYRIQERASENTRQKKGTAKLNFLFQVVERLSDSNALYQTLRPLTSRVRHVIWDNDHQIDQTPHGDNKPKVMLPDRVFQRRVIDIDRLVPRNDSSFAVEYETHGESGGNGLDNI